MIDDLWEILFYFILLVIGFFVEDKILPLTSDNPKKIILFLIDLNLRSV